MRDDQPIDEALARLRRRAEAAIPDGFMDDMWARAGQMEEVSLRRMRVALFATMAFVGLGAGFGATQGPANAETAGYRLIEGADLSPAALLHVER